MILLDVNMPGMDGLETAELIRSRRKSAHTPIIFITAFADEMPTARGYSLGAVDSILSPVVPNILRSKVKALVQLHRLNAELKRHADERVALAKEQAARAVAVLPFVNAGGLPDDEAFSDGITDEIIAVLSRVENLRVASRTSASGKPTMWNAGNPGPR